MNLPSFPDRRRAFTLIELLVVITIIAVLAALLMPAITGAQQEAKASRCLSNLRQILAARKEYTSDNNGVFMPLRPAWPQDGNGVCTWRYYLVKKYNLPLSVFLCPTAPSVGHEAGGDSFRTANSDVPSNYAAPGDAQFAVTMLPNTAVPALSMARIQNPSQQLEVFETRDNWPDLQISNWGTTWGDGYGTIGYWHQLRMNCGYADGHVERKKLGETATPVCQWSTISDVDATGQLEDGKVVHAGYYGAMPSYYK